jgi:hypothetical protein
MPLPSIDVAFVEEFEAGVHLAYQRMGSKIRGTVRTKSGVKNKTTFQKVGKGQAGDKPRNGLVPVMNLDHTNVNVTVVDKYAAEYIDDLDELRINHDEKQVAMMSGAAALGRTTDDQLITAMRTTTNTESELVNGMTFDFALTILKNFGNRDVPDDGNRYVALTWDNWAQLLKVQEFTNADYIGADELPLVKAGTQAIRWMNMVWYPHSGLPDSGVNKVGLAYHSTAVGHAIGADVSSNMSYIAERDSWLVCNKMQMNAVLIDENGCIELTMAP